MQVENGKMQKISPNREECAGKTLGKQMKGQAKIYLIQGLSLCNGVGYTHTHTHGCPSECTGTVEESKETSTQLHFQHLFYCLLMQWNLG